MLKLSKSLTLAGCAFSFFVGTSSLSAATHLGDKELWNNVVTIDRLAWQEREGIKKVNKLADDQTLVRRLYVDITGKIPTYEQLVRFLKDKDINKKQKLIDSLLDTPGYASNLSNMWGDLLRIPYREGGDLANHHNDFKTYIERLVYENKPYDKMVKDMITAEGLVMEDGGVSFYYRDFQTDPMDTTNATVKAFLGTRIGCAQCHNHRFDKWTQKEFYELSAHMWGVQTKDTHGTVAASIIRNHSRNLKDEGFTAPVTANMLYVLTPSRQSVSFNESDRLQYPEGYVYDNAKPLETVKERIVFSYGDTEVKGKDRREVFANWLTSKNNPMFARVMANRLWKRIMGVAVMEPVDDWKDNVEVQNPQLFAALGDIFASVDYDFKAFLSVVFNSEAYQMAVDEKNELDSENYKIQGAALKRMSAPQLRDSLLTLKHGNLDKYAKMGSIYFEFQNKLKALAVEFHNIIAPKSRSFLKANGLEGQQMVDTEMMSLMIEYAEKVQELEAEYNIGPDGLIGSKGDSPKLAQKGKPEEKKGMMMQKEGSMSTANGKVRPIIRANLVDRPEFMEVFGSTDRSAPQTGGSQEATIKQILKMINSNECKDVVKKESYLMSNMYKKEKVGERVAYLYYSLYGRVPNKKELGIAGKFLGNSNKHDRWASYALALINSPEFYFVQ